MPRFVGNYLFVSEKGRFSKVVAKSTYPIASQGIQRKIEREVAVVRVVLRGVVDEEVVGGKSPTHRPTKRRKVVGVWTFGLANGPAQGCCPATDRSARKLSRVSIRFIFGAAALGAVVA